MLTAHFVRKFARRMQKPIAGIPAELMKSLMAWEWPGNIRELENFIERAVILTRGSLLEAPLSEPHKVNSHFASPAGLAREGEIQQIVRETLNALKARRESTREPYQKQREDIVRALAESKGQVGGLNGAAARMGVNRTTLISRIKKFGIDPRQYA